MLIDYAETRAEQVRELISAAGEPASPVRLLLLGRSAGEWWKQLRSELRYYLGPPWQASLPPLEDTSAGRAAAYHDAVEDLVAALPRLPGRAGTDWGERADRLPRPDLSDPAFGAVLTIQLHALTGLLSADDPARTLHPDELEDILLEHEELYWRQTARWRGLMLQPETLRRAVATVIMCGAGTEDEGVATITRVPGLTDRSRDERLGVARWLAELYPARESRYWGLLQPDRVGEHLVGRVTADRPDLAATVLDGATPEQRYLALTVLTRAGLHQPHLGALLGDLLSTHLPTLGPVAVQVAVQAADPSPLLDALRGAALAVTDPADLSGLIDALPERSTLLAQISLDSTAHWADLYRSLAEAAPDAYLPDLALSLNNLSIRLAEVGRREQALAPIEEAARVYRRLAEAAPDAYLPNLALSLTTLGIRLTELQRHRDALVADREAVQLYVRLQANDPQRFDEATQNALKNLAIDLRDLGLTEIDIERELKQLLASDETQ